jgi:hypothetical protein
VAREPIAALTPSVTGTVTSYTVSPALPSGLALDAATGRISGTPTAPAAMAVYTVSASNSSGSGSFGLSLEVVTVTASAATISRIVSSGTSVDVTISVQPVNFSFTNDLFVAASGPAGVFNPSVAVAPNGNGTYTLNLTTAAAAPAARHTGQLTLDLCRDPSCSSRQVVGRLNVPIDVQVMSADTEWPGDTLSTLAAWPDVPDWGTFQGNAGHTGYVPAEVDPNEFSTRWTTRNTGLSTAFVGKVGTVVTGGDRLFTVASDTEMLKALEEFDGSLAWQYDFSGLQFPSVNPPAVANGTVYIAAGQQYSTFMHAFNAGDGSLVFKSTMGSQWENYLAPTVGANGVYTNAGAYGGLYAFDPTGQQLFFAYMPQTASWSPAVDDSAVYAYTIDTLRVVDPLSGTVLHSITDPTFDHFIYDIGGSAVLGAPGSVFAANYANSALSGAGGNTLLNFDVPNDAIKWQVAGSYPTTPAYHDGVVYATNENPFRIEARSEANGELLWSWTPPHAADIRFDSEVLLTDNLLFVSTNRSVYAIDRVTHRPVWSFPASGHLALSRNGILYIETLDRLIAINLK